MTDGDPGPVGAAARSAPRRGRVRSMMEDHWRAEQGWSVPNAAVYPWLWLWDSCFHALVWDALDDPRAVRELAGVFAAQTPSGFVPHMNYAADPGAFADFWGIRGASTITQPPMYGHAVAELARHDRDVSGLVGPARRALLRLLDARRAPCGLLRILHPWESGIDDHVRWAAWQPEPFGRSGWYDTKGRMVEALTVVDGEAVASGAFDVCSAGFNALVAWNARELAGLDADAELSDGADALVEALERYWDPARRTWTDAGPDGAPGSAVRTLDALLPVLVSRRPERLDAAFAEIADPSAFGLPYGPAGVAADEAAFVADSYGRGCTWPQLTYLLWCAARRAGRADDAARLGRWLREGSDVSGLAEYWDPRDGAGLGARPQSWCGLAVLVGGD